MKLSYHRTQKRSYNSIPGTYGLTLAVTLVLALSAHRAAAQAQPANVASADIKTADIKAAEIKPIANSYETIYLANVSQQNDLNDIQTALRNMLPQAKIYGEPSQNAISLRATPEDILTAKKIIADLDRARKTYRLTYTITEMDGATRSGSRRYSVIVTSGGKTTLKQGTKVPVVTGSTATESEKQGAQVQYQYIDVGLNIDASLEVYADGVRLHSKVEQSGVAEEKSTTAAIGPIIRQTTLDTTSTLTAGKPLILGALDVPGTTRHEDVEVVAELIH